jgi:hypothetical protein
MRSPLKLEILPQPDDTTCGPTCLHAVYNYFGETMELSEVIREVHYLEDGGTLAVLLANHALKRGYQATLYSYNLHVFDPTWTELSTPDLITKLKLQNEFKTGRKFQKATNAYLEFLELGGVVKFKDLNPALIRSLLKKEIPVLTGLSATYLYQCAREFGPNCDYDDIRGLATGHFVVLSGYDEAEKTVRVADPIQNHPGQLGSYYDVRMDRLINAILLGILTYDANLLVLEPS